MNKSLENIEKELCELLDQLDTEAVLSVAVMQLLLRPTGEFSEYRGNHPALLEVIARHTIPRFGANRGIIVTHQHFNQCYKLAEEYLAKRMMSSLNAGSIEEAASNLDKISNSLKMQSEVVRGKAYPEQTRYRIIEIQGHFDKWFEQKTGISPSKAVKIIDALVKHCESVYSENSPKFYEYADQFKEDDNKRIVAFFSKLSESVPTLLPIHLEDLEIQPQVSESEGNALKELIGISKDTIIGLDRSQDFEIQRYPLYVLTSGKVLLSDWSNCLDVLWDKFEEVIKGDNNYYSRYQKYLATWLESKAYDYFKRIFPAEAIYKTLDYPNPDKAGTTELDLAIKWGPFLLLIEAKAKQFRFESVRGDVGRLRTDVSKNIEEAYTQTTRAIRYIHSVDKAEFIERDSGRKLSVDKNNIQKIYPISLSLHNFAGIATQLKETQELGLFKEGNFPFSICIADLDLITKTEIIPVVLIHYMEKRLSLLNESQSIKVTSDDEIDLFENYLESRLNFNGILQGYENIKNADITVGGSGKFELLAAYERGEYPVKPNMSLSVPPLISELLQQLCARNDDGAKLIALMLLDLDDQMLLELSEALSKITEATIPLDIFRRYSFANKEVVVTVMGSNPASSPALPALKKERLLGKVHIEKYRRKLNKSLGIGILCTETKELSIDTILYVEGEWIEDRDLKNLVENEPEIASVVTGSKLPKRNDPCFCGSGKKYKKCCLAKVEKGKSRNRL